MFDKRKMEKRTEAGVELMLDDLPGLLRFYKKNQRLDLKNRSDLISSLILAIQERANGAFDQDEDGSFFVPKKDFFKDFIEEDVKDELKSNESKESNILSKLQELTKELYQYKSEVLEARKRINEEKINNSEEVIRKYSESTWGRVQKLIGLKLYSIGKKKFYKGKNSLNNLSIEGNNEDRENFEKEMKEIIDKNNNYLEKRNKPTFNIDIPSFGGIGNIFNSTRKKVGNVIGDKLKEWVCDKEGKGAVEKKGDKSKNKDEEKIESDGEGTIANKFKKAKEGFRSFFDGFGDDFGERFEELGDEFMKKFQEYKEKKEKQESDVVHLLNNDKEYKNFIKNKDFGKPGDYYKKIIIKMVSDDKKDEKELERLIIRSWKESDNNERKEMKDRDYSHVGVFVEALYPIIEEIRKEYKSEVKEESE